MTQPAFLGGDPTFPTGPPNWPPADPEVSLALETAFRDGSWGKYHGPNSLRLTQWLSAMHGVEFVTLCASGTIAVELALRGLLVGPKDEVILAGYDFPGNFRAIEATGARPVLVDIDPRTWSLDPQCLSQAIRPMTRAIVVSHLHGGTAAMPDIMDIASNHRMAVIEDACQSPGARVSGHLAGTTGDVAILSFGGSKLVTAGRGGAVLTSDSAIHQRMKVFSERGNQAFPMSELQAAVIPPQLDRLAQRNKTRLENVRRLLRGIQDVQTWNAVAPADAGDQPAYYKLAWAVDQCVADPIYRNKLIKALQAEGLAIDTGFRGFVRRSTSRCRRAGDPTHSAQAAESTILLHHPLLLEPAHVLDQAADAIKKVTAAM